MQAIKRLIPVAQIACWGVIALLVVNAVLWGVDAVTPNWLPYRMAGEGFRDDITQRVQAAQVRYAADVGHDEYFCVLLGLSSLREGTDLKLLGQLGSAKCRYLGLCGAGPALDAIPEEAHELEDSKLRPDLVIIGVNEFLQAKPVAPPTEAGGASGGGGAATPVHSKFIGDLLHHDLRNMVKDVLSWVWFYERRRDVSGEIESLLLSGKEKILHALGAHMNNPLNDPWREMIRLGGPDHASAAALREQLAAYAKRNLFAANTYDTTQARAQIESLSDLIRLMKSRGATVVVVLMPEYSQLRSQIPAIAVTQLETQLKAGLSASAPPILNLRDALPDDDFTDIAHVNPEGREAFTKLLAAKVAEYLPRSRPPLMSATESEEPSR